jgi:hypothetical protein
MLFLIDTTAAANKRSMKLDQQGAFRYLTTKKRFYSLTFFLCTLDSYLMTDLRIGDHVHLSPKVIARRELILIA